MKRKADADSSSSTSDSSNSNVILLSDTESDLSDSDESSASVQFLESRTIEIINLDDTAEDFKSDCESVITIHDSTILDETQDSFKLDTTPDFIPINCYVDKPGKGKTLSRKFRKAKKRKEDDDHLNQNSNSKRKEPNFRTPVIQLSYPNILNDNAEPQRIGLRPIIIDGCNVGFGYGNGNFMMRGIIIVIQYFKNRGHEEIVCFLPQKYRHKIRSLSEDRIVNSLEKESVFSFTPSRLLENGKRYSPYDDRYIVQYATERQGVIISNDGYRDIINEESSWRETIEKRIINYTFARGIFMLPKDPLGPDGPTLDEMLKFS